MHCGRKRYDEVEVREDSAIVLMIAMTQQREREGHCE